MNNERLNEPTHIVSESTDSNAIDDIKQGSVPLMGQHINIGPVSDQDNILIDLQGKHSAIINLGLVNSENGSVTINLDANIDQCNIGDQFILMWKKIGNDSVMLNLSDKFYLNRCGGVNQNNSFNNVRIMIPFMFDGEVFCNTYDNC